MPIVDVQWDFARWPPPPGNVTYVGGYTFEGFSMLVVALFLCMVLYVCHASCRTPSARRAQVAIAQAASAQAASSSMPYLDAHADVKVEEPAVAFAEQEPADEPPSYREILLRSA